MKVHGPGHGDDRSTHGYDSDGEDSNSSESISITNGPSSPIQTPNQVQKQNPAATTAIGTVLSPEHGHSITAKLEDLNNKYFNSGENKAPNNGNSSFINMDHLQPGHLQAGGGNHHLDHMNHHHHHQMAAANLSEWYVCQSAGGLQTPPSQDHSPAPHPLNHHHFANHHHLMHHHHHGGAATAY